MAKPFFLAAVIIAVIMMLTIFSCPANGQVTLRQWNEQVKKSKISDSVYISSGRLSLKPNRDTIRVVMLVCDTLSTSWVDSGIVNGKIVQIGEVHKNYHQRGAYWIYGYAVREYFSREIMWHVEYLGEEKKTLNYKIVWISKEVGHE